MSDLLKKLLEDRFFSEENLQLVRRGDGDGDGGGSGDDGSTDNGDDGGYSSDSDDGSTDDGSGSGHSSDDGDGSDHSGTDTNDANSGNDDGHSDSDQGNDGVNGLGTNGIDSDAPGAWNSPGEGPDHGNGPDGGFGPSPGDENTYQNPDGTWSFDLGHALGFDFAANNPNAHTSVAVSDPNDVHAFTMFDLANVQLAGLQDLSHALFGTATQQTSAWNGLMSAMDYANHNGIALDGGICSIDGHDYGYNHGVTVSIDGNITAAGLVDAARSELADLGVQTSYLNSVVSAGNVSFSKDGVSVGITTPGLGTMINGVSITDLMSYISTAKP